MASETLALQPLALNTCGKVVGLEGQAEALRKLWPRNWNQISEELGLDLI